jgi:hypothetical protein
MNTIAFALFGMTFGLSAVMDTFVENDPQCLSTPPISTIKVPLGQCVSMAQLTNQYGAAAVKGLVEQFVTPEGAQAGSFITLERNSALYPRLFSDNACDVSAPIKNGQFIIQVCYGRIKFTKLERDDTSSSSTATSVTTTATTSTTTGTITSTTPTSTPTRTSNAEATRPLILFLLASILFL